MACQTSQGAKHDEVVQKFMNEIYYAVRSHINFDSVKAILIGRYVMYTGRVTLTYVFLAVEFVKYDSTFRLRSKYCNC